MIIFFNMHSSSCRLRTFFSYDVPRPELKSTVLKHRLVWRPKADILYLMQWSQFIEIYPTPLLQCIIMNSPHVEANRHQTRLEGIKNLKILVVKTHGKWFSFFVIEASWSRNKCMSASGAESGETFVFVVGRHLSADSMNRLWNGLRARDHSKWIFASHFQFQDFFSLSLAAPKTSPPWTILTHCEIKLRAIQFFEYRQTSSPVLAPSIKKYTSATSFSTVGPLARRKANAPFHEPFLLRLPLSPTSPPVPSSRIRGTPRVDLNGTS